MEDRHTGRLGEDITRLLLTRPEAEALIQEIPQIKEMTVANDKQREERYKEALKT